MRPTLLGLDYLSGHPLYKYQYETCDLSSDIQRLTSFITKQNDLEDFYYRPDTIIKSSVGEFYDENMKFFLETLKLLYGPVMDKVNKNPIGIYPGDLFASLVPMGALIGSNMNAPVFKKGDSVTYRQDGLYSPMPEIRELVKECGGVPESKFHKTRTERIERIAHAICAGYTPQKIEDVKRVPFDSGFLSEYLIANMLYPWVTQPLSQLRMLVPSLGKDTIQNIADIYMGRPDEGTKLNNGLDVGYAYTYDIISDFHTYSYFKNLKTEHPLQISRQFRTPFMLFDIPAVLTDLDDGLKKRIDECAQRSKRLYVEILKTGLRYYAQYAVLGGYRGRFSMSGNLASIVEVIDLLFQESPKPARIVEAIKRDVLQSTRVVKEAGLFK